MGLWSIAVVPNLFGTRDQFRRRQFFHRPREGRDGFRMIQVHYTDHALYFVAFSGYFTLTLGLGFVLLWEPNAAADLTGGGTQAVTWVMESGCKYRGSSTRVPATHLLLYGPVPNRPQTSTGVWPRGWGHLIYRITVLIRRGARGLTLPLPCMGTDQGKAMWGHSEKAASYKTEISSHQKGPCWHLDLGLPASKLWKMNVCLSHPTCGILLWQFKQSNTYISKVLWLFLWTGGNISLVS